MPICFNTIFTLLTLLLPVFCTWRTQYWSVLPEVVTGYPMTFSTILRLPQCDVVSSLVMWRTESCDKQYIGVESSLIGCDPFSAFVPVFIQAELLYIEPTAIRDSKIASCPILSLSNYNSAQLFGSGSFLVASLIQHVDGSARVWVTIDISNDQVSDVGHQLVEPLITLPECPGEPAVTVESIDDIFYNNIIALDNEYKARLGVSCGGELHIYNIFVDTETTKITAQHKFSVSSLNFTSTEHLIRFDLYGTNVLIAGVAGDPAHSNHSWMVLSVAEEEGTVLHEGFGTSATWVSQNVVANLDGGNIYFNVFERAKPTCTALALALNDANGIPYQKLRAPSLVPGIISPILYVFSRDDGGAFINLVDGSELTPRSKLCTITNEDAHVNGEIELVYRLHTLVGSITAALSPTMYLEDVQLGSLSAVIALTDRENGRRSVVTPMGRCTSGVPVSAGCLIMDNQTWPETMYVQGNLVVSCPTGTKCRNGEIQSRFYTDGSPGDCAEDGLMVTIRSSAGDSDVTIASPAGFYCPSGSKLSACPVDHYCPAGSGAPKKCPSGQFSDANSFKVEQCTGMLAINTFSWVSNSYRHSYLYNIIILVALFASLWVASLMSKMVRTNIYTAVAAKSIEAAIVYPSEGSAVNTPADTDTSDQSSSTFSQRSSLSRSSTDAAHLPELSTDEYSCDGPALFAFAPKAGQTEGEVQPALPIISPFLAAHGVDAVGSSVGELQLNVQPFIFHNEMPSEQAEKIFARPSESSTVTHSSQSTVPTGHTSVSDYAGSIPSHVAFTNQTVSDFITNTESTQPIFIPQNVIEFSNFVPSNQPVFTDMSSELTEETESSPPFARKAIDLQLESSSDD